MRENPLQRNHKCLPEGTSWLAENSGGSSFQLPGPVLIEPEMRGKSSTPSQLPFRSSRLGSQTPKPKLGSCGASLSAISGFLKELSTVKTSRTLRQSGFLRCAKCLSHRPADPDAHFCTQCGAVVPPVPEQRLPPAERGQTGFCASCHTIVPVSCGSCVICESFITPDLQQQAGLTVQGHVICVCCGSGNPTHLSSCVSCESRLPTAVSCSNSTPCATSGDNRMLLCSKCKRLNHRDARYCNWCGFKPGHAVNRVTCCRCGASEHPYAFHCAACGAFLEAPVSPTSCTKGSQSTGGAITHNQVHCSSSIRTLKGPSCDTTWHTTHRVINMALPTADQQTQTVGLFYPSSTELERKEQQRALELIRKQHMRDGHLLLTAISPGRGYWRKQLDHVCAHLRSYAQNNAPFRALLGEPRLGRMVSAVIQEDQHEVSLTISFLSARQETPQMDAVGGAVEPAGNGQSAGLGKPQKPVQTPKPPLLQELGPNRGQINVIAQILDQGADPSCCSSDGSHALVVAVENGHHDIIPVLVQRGADVNQRSGRMKNTALHQAAALGSEGLQSAQILLSCKASVRLRNARGQTPYDVALSSGCDAMVSLLAAGTGRDMLDKLGQPRPDLAVR
ncbi:double zinc ribbon and ankyrin repeat-containing protein 1 isoform X2 [Thalassophryne amazonica]|uniref:double zinc ribbon and ankyrin repeat-containing protein 1 isoform X2 n=1 Tax=Thalassophryne amazonica TaxID=390379 RepID=UPI001471692A|nr:double zinc ribbon and ankyrin repeat-containing protein 1 isoform X2 [Thalassophryne amazonica]XP_034044359.1 double zinc ribbon and ankyrin repeat-containing protein 1 isoform X2 [Thalassophryne amazonica]XP_034044360.1 double zinc ribbon and ankyrin repeat-containing protein 1 isoform X2 [Thalassophryne amazonica]